MPLIGPARSTGEEAVHVHWGILGRPPSEPGRLRQGAGGHPGRDRRRSVLMVPTLGSDPMNLDYRFSPCTLSRAVGNVAFSRCGGLY